MTTDSAVSRRLSAALEEALGTTGALGAVAAVRLASGAWVAFSGGRAGLWADAGPPDPRATYPLFSLTKTVVAAAVLRLRDAGQLRLRQCAGDFAGKRGDIPEWLAPAKLIDLLRHTSPLPEYTGLESYNEAVIEHPDAPWPTDEIFQAVDPLHSAAREEGSPDAAGKNWCYCNTGYWALGRVLENVADAPLAEALQSLIFQPLQLASMNYGIPERAVLGPTHSTYLSKEGEELECSTLYDPRWAGPAGGVVGNVADYGSFSETLLLKRSFLSRPSLDLMLTRMTLGEPHFPAKYKIGYGLGLFFDSASPLGVLAGHGGFGPGCHTIAKTALSSGAAVILVSNSERADPDRLAMPLLKLADTMS